MDRNEAAHLLRRVGFGGRPEDIEPLLSARREDVVDAMLAPPPDDEFPHLTAIDGRTLDWNRLEDVQAWWTWRLLHTERPLLEKMTLYWHDHFATSYYKVLQPRLLWEQNRTFRRLAFGDFRDLLSAMLRDPAMLIWLDGDSNHRHAPNENWARELMELFTIGVGPYTETDVGQSALAFTGWAQKDGQTHFDPGDHVPGPKPFLGHIVQSGDDVIAILADHPETGRFVATKLVRFFGLSPAPASVVADLARVYTSSGRSMKAVMRSLLLSDAFYSNAARMTHIKSPAEFVVSSVRLTGATPSPYQAHQAMARMGQELFNPPTVKGWDPDMAWISSLSMLERFNFGAEVAATLPGTMSGSPMDWSARLIQGPIHPARAQVVEECKTLADAVQLLLSLPEFQLC